MNATLAHAEDNPSSAIATLHRLKEDINEQVATPLAHTLRMAGGHLTTCQLTRRKHLAKSVKDQQLSRWLEETDETLTHLFPPDVSGAMEASRALRTDGLLSLASRAVSSAHSANRHPTGTSLNSFRG